MGGAGALILPVAGEGVLRGRPLFRPRSGEQEGDAGGRWAGPGRGARVAAQLGPGGGVWAAGLVGGSGPFFLCFLFLFCFLFSFFVYFLFCFISFKSI